MTPQVVVDASAVVDALLQNERGRAVVRRLAGRALTAPAHLDAEVLSALGRLARAGEIPDAAVTDRLARLRTAPIDRRPLTELIEGAWRRRERLPLADALYVELAAILEAPLVTTDRRLRPAAVEVEIVDA